MGLLTWLLPRRASAEEAYCSQELPKMWSSFVDNFVDAGFSGQSCSNPDEVGASTQPLPLQLPHAERLIAIGDLHGDLSKARRAFRLAGLTNEKDRWIGGSSVCVQVGDILDRGDAEIQILYFLERLQTEAAHAGGRLHVLNGNHETMNVMGNTRYATHGSCHEIARWKRWQMLGELLKSACTAPSPKGSKASSSTAPGGAAVPAGLQAMQASGAFGSVHHGRVNALQPGSPLTMRFFADHPTVLQVGQTVFVHGGVLPQHVEYGLDNINSETRAWLKGGSGPRTNPVPSFLKGASAIVWARDYSTEDHGKCDCATLEKVLSLVPGSSRMVMGHTIQDEGINAACGGKALRVDVGMSKGCGNGNVEVLEIIKDGEQVRRLREGLPAVDMTPSPVSMGSPVLSPAYSPQATLSGTRVPSAILPNGQGGATPIGHSWQPPQMRTGGGGGDSSHLSSGLGQRPVEPSMA